MVLDPREHGGFGPNEFAARIGGDEFVIVQSGDVQSAMRLVSRIASTLQEEFKLEVATARIGTNIGIAHHPPDAQTPEPLLKLAEIAL